MRGRCRECPRAARRGGSGRVPGPPLPRGHAFDVLARMIHGRTGGNPLFVVNVADDLVRRGVLIERGGRWEVEAAPPRRDRDPG